ncbi:MAG TPA: TetR/AcrR family transcriptional regulator [Bacillales bacterium]|nr:TetR/AcrR family transcriptional regulator [Bacillales bacterium]
MTKKNQPKYKKIIDAAVIVIAENGFDQAQISKIARQAGVADGTIYLYFKNKEDLLISLFREKMGQFIEHIENEIAEKQSVEEKMLTLIDMHFKQLSADYRLAIVTQLELRQSNKGLRAKIGEVLKRYLAVIDDILEKGIEQGVFHPDLDVRIARQMIFGTLDETVTNWVLNEQKYDLKSLAGPVNHLLIHGLNRSGSRPE